MDEPRDKRIMSLVHACMDMDSATRQRFLVAECAGDERLRAAVESLLDENVLKTGLHPSTQRLTKVLPEHYQLLQLIGAGGMAEVYLAEDKRLGRKVAIKFLHDALRNDPERMLRFAQEARSASALNHPNIITIHDIGESDGIQYIVSEYVDGETLASQLTKEKTELQSQLDSSAQALGDKPSDADKQKLVEFGQSLIDGLALRQKLDGNEEPEARA